MSMGRRGVFTPMRFEADVEECLVDGELPRDLAGGFYRCGPTWKRPSKQNIDTVFTMDGMVQALILRDGRADFRNRWIRTPKYLAEERAGRALFEWADGDFDDWRAWGLGDVVRDEHTRHVPQGVSAANSFPFAGQILTSGEQGLPPMVLDPITLETKGMVPWAPALDRGMAEKVCYGDGTFTAHPKWDSRTGELYGLSYSDVEPFVTMYWIAPDGAVRPRPLWDAPYAQVAHDMWLTGDWIVVPFQPFTISRERIAKDDGAYGWEPTLPMKLALVPRFDLSADIRWITADIEPEYIMHTLAANTDEGTIALDAPIFNRPPFQTSDISEPGDPSIPFFQVASSTMGRWTIDLARGTVTTERTGDRLVELPKIDERFFGRPYRWGFLLGGTQSTVRKEGMRMDSLIQRDVRTGEERSYQITDDRHVAVLEPVFAPRTSDAPEGDGYVIVALSKFMESRGEYQIFDTDDITAGPIARIELPFHIGWTPHGHWMDFRDGGLG